MDKLHRAAQLFIDRSRETKIAQAAYIAAQHAEAQAHNELRNALTEYKLAHTPTDKLVERMFDHAAQRSEGSSTTSLASESTLHALSNTNIAGR